MLDREYKSFRWKLVDQEIRVVGQNSKSIVFFNNSCTSFVSILIRGWSKHNIFISQFVPGIVLMFYIQQAKKIVVWSQIYRNLNKENLNLLLIIENVRFLMKAKGPSFCKQCLLDLQFMKTRSSSPNLSKLARADISC